MKEEGIVFICNANVGMNIDVGDLLREHDAIILAGGSTVPRDLNIPGRELQGVHFAMQFLKQQNKRNAGLNAVDWAETESNISQNEINARGKHVIVIGGGDTGSDCVGTASRQRAKSVKQFELLPKPPEERTAYMPWPQYPMLYKNTSSHEEGCEREFAIATKEFLGDDKGCLRALKVVNLEWVAGDDGRPAKFAEVPGTEREIPCSLILLAMGFTHPQLNGMIEEMDIKTDERKNIKADDKHYQTNISKVFAAGDMRRGQSLVVWAISEGRECAARVDVFLTGSTLLECKEENIAARFTS